MNCGYILFVEYNNETNDIKDFVIVQLFTLNKLILTFYINYSIYYIINENKKKILEMRELLKGFISILIKDIINHNEIHHTINKEMIMQYNKDKMINYDKGN